jgi:predicted nucleic acid-binding protein
VIVLDSSAALDYLLRLEPRATWVEPQLETADWEIHVPHVFDVEVVGVVRHLTRLGAMNEVLAVEVLADLAALEIQRHAHVELTERAWELRRLVTVADAMFIALAERLEAPLVTTDHWLGRVYGLTINELRTPVLVP